MHPLSHGIVYFIMKLGVILFVLDLNSVHAG